MSSLRNFKKNGVELRSGTPTGSVACGETKMVLWFVENYGVRAAEVLTSGGVEDSNENFVQLVNSVPTLALDARRNVLQPQVPMAAGRGSMEDSAWPYTETLSGRCRLEEALRRFAWKVDVIKRTVVFDT